MYWLDWIIIFIPLVVVLIIGLKAQKYVKTVADFLAAGRVAGRYVICVASGEAGMGLISLVAIWEMYYKCGFAVGFWGSISAPLGLFLSLTGYCTYRYRETRAMTMGQFFEMRYNRPFRIYAAFLQSISGVVNYAIFPAVGARCIMYFLNLPPHINIGGWNFPTFGLLMLVFLSIAVWIITQGGQITIMVTDCVQGLISYPFYAIICIYIFYKFDWMGQIVPTLLDRNPGESMLNPYDIQNLRTFNLFYVFTGIFGTIFSRMSWAGTQGYSAAAKSAHENKMGALLGTWRGGFSSMMYILLAIAAFTYMLHADFRKDSNRVHTQLTKETVKELAHGKEFKEVREDLIYMTEHEGVVPKTLQDRLAKDKNFAKKKIDISKPVDPRQYKDVAHSAVATVDPTTGKSIATIYNQMTVPVALRDMLPIGVTGILCALMIFLMISTDTTYMHSWGSIIAQDIVLPLRKKPFTPKEQINCLRYIIAGVAVFAFLFSFFFAQMDYILMFFAITGAIWAGAGPVITLGLYWKKGNAFGAFASLITGSGIALLGILFQQTWPKYIYPYLERHNMVEGVTKFFWNVSKPLHPYVMWEVTPNEFPINSTEIGFIGLLSSVAMYALFSLITYKKDFNLEKLLHRGQYADGPEPEKIPWTFKTVFQKIIGIDAQYTTGDKILAWSVFIWSFVYGFSLCFLGVVIWNAIYKWPNHWWAIKFNITGIIIPVIIAIVSTVWFSIGGTKDLIQLFKDLANKKDDYTDNGTVSHDDDDDAPKKEEEKKA